MNKLKIAFVGSPDYPIPAIWGGAIQTLVTALMDENEKRKEFDFFVFTISTPELKEKIEDYQYSTIIPIKTNFIHKAFLLFRKILRRLTKNRIPYRSHYMKVVNRHIKKQHFDYVIFESTDKEIVQVKKPKNTKVLYHVHADYLSNKTDRIKQICDVCDGFISVSDFIKQRLTQIDFLDESRVHTLHNAIQLNTLDRADLLSHRVAIRKKYGFDEHDKVIIYCGRLSPEKGCLELIKAVKLINNCKLMVVGGENFSSNERTPYIEKMLEEASKLEDRIVFTGYIPHVDVPKYIMAADIAVVPSVCNEAASLALLEFRNIGLPTIASLVGGISEYSNGTTVFVKFDKNYVQRLADTIYKIIEAPDMCDFLKSEATKDIEKFGYKKYYERFEKLIKMLA